MPRPKGDARLWQLALRHEVMDLDDGAVRVARADDGLQTLAVDGVLGGRVRTLTVGANLYWGERAQWLLSLTQARVRRFDPARGAVLRDAPELAALRFQYSW